MRLGKKERKALKLKEAITRAAKARNERAGVSTLEQAKQAPRGLRTSLKADIPNVVSTKADWSWNANKARSLHRASKVRKG